MQLIAREVEVEAMRRVMPKKSEHGEQGKKSTAPQNQRRFDNHIQRLQPKAVQPIKIVEAVTKDFFGRITTKKPTTENQSKQQHLQKPRIWYHYKEGFNNAVRKDVTIQKLL